MLETLFHRDWETLGTSDATSDELGVRATLPFHRPKAGGRECWAGGGHAHWPGLEDKTKELIESEQ